MLGSRNRHQCHLSQWAGRGSREMTRSVDAVEKDFDGVTQATLIQGERRTGNIDSKIHLFGFDCFKI
jgi:hypothetical protein